MRSIVTRMVILNAFTGRSKLTQKHGKRRALNNDTRATLSNVSNIVPCPPFENLKVMKPQARMEQLRI